MEEKEIAKSDCTNHGISFNYDPESKIPMIDIIYDNYGYKWNSIKILICGYLFLLVCGIQNTFLPSMLNGYIDLFNLTESLTILITSLYFVFKMIGSVALGYISHQIKRTNLILIFLGCSTVGMLLNGYFYNSFSLFCIIRIIIGLLNGITEPAILNLVIEHLPIRLRGFFVVSLWFGFNIGQLLINLIMLKSMPNYEPEGISITITISGFIILGCFLFCLFFIEESPRYYMLKSNDKKARNELRKLNPYLTDDDFNLVKFQTISGENSEHTYSYLEVFKSEHLKSTLLLAVIMFLADCLFDGSGTVTPLTLVDYKTKERFSPLIGNIINQTIMLPSNLISGILAETKLFGRKYSLLIGSVLLTVFITAVVINPSLTYLFVGFFNFFLTFLTNIIDLYIAEVFPSVMRDSASGMINGVGNFGSAIAQVLFLSLYFKSKMLPYYTMIVCGTVASVCCALLPYETYRKPLDTHLNEPIPDIEEEKLNLII